MAIHSYDFPRWKIIAGFLTYIGPECIQVSIMTLELVNLNVPQMSTK